MKRILLINPKQNSHKIGEKPMYPSGALLLIGTMCLNKGHEVEIYDSSVNKEDLKEVLSRFRPNIVGITVNTFQIKYAIDAISAVKEYDMNIVVVIGGPHPSAIGIDSLKVFMNVDIAVMGEGEFAFLEIVDGKALNEIDGICYNGVKNKDRAASKSLSHIPVTNLSLVDLNEYTGFQGTKSGESMFIMASRGCPFGCIYCNKSIFGTQVRFREPNEIIEEVRWLHDQYGIKHIYFQDDTFNLRWQWLEDILNQIIKNELNVDISYVAPFRANNNLVDEKLLKLVKKANFDVIFYGVESGNQQMLNRMHKGLNISEIKRAFKLTHEAGLKTIGAFIVGLPGENIETIKDTINLWKEIRPTYSGFTLATPFPNTEFEQEIMANGNLLDNNYKDYRCGGNYVKTDELSKKELEYYSNVMTFGLCLGHEWILKMPIFEVGKNKVTRICALSAIHYYNFLKDLKLLISNKIFG